MNLATNCGRWPYNTGPVSAKRWIQNYSFSQHTAKTVMSMTCADDCDKTYKHWQLKLTLIVLEGFSWIIHVCVCLQILHHIRSDYRHSISHEDVRVDNRSKLVQQVWSLLKQVTSCLLHALLKQSCSWSWHSIPCFWLAPTDSAISTLPPLFNNTWKLRMQLSTSLAP